MVHDYSDEEIEAFWDYTILLQPVSIYKPSLVAIMAFPAPMKETYKQVSNISTL